MRKGMIPCSAFFATSLTSARDGPKQASSGYGGVTAGAGRRRPQRAGAGGRRGRRPGLAGLDRQGDIGERPLAGEAASLGVADLVIRLGPQDFLPGLGAGGNAERDAPGDLILEVLDELDILEDLVFLAYHRLRGGPVAGDLQSRGVEEIELGVLWTFLHLLLGVRVDVVSGPELGRDPIGDRLSRPGHVRLDRGRQRGGLRPGDGPAVRLGRLGGCGLGRTAPRRTGPGRARRTPPWPSRPGPGRWTERSSYA